MPRISRRTLLASIGAAGAASFLKPLTASAQRGSILTRAIPSS